MKKINKTEERTCIFLKLKFQKSQLLRFIIENQKIIFDNPNKRGYYLKIDSTSNIDLILKMLINRFKIINIDECKKYLVAYKG